MPDSHVGQLAAKPAVWLNKLFLTEEEEDLRVEALVPGNGNGTLVIVAVTSSEVKVLGTRTSRSLLELSVSRSQIPAESLVASGEYWAMFDPADASKPGVYVVLSDGTGDSPTLTREAWLQMAQAGEGSAPIGASLSVLSGATLLPEGAVWPISSIGPDAYWIVSSTTPARLAMVVVSPETLPPASLGSFLVRRGRRGVVVAPTWTLAPGCPSLGYVDLSQLISETGTTATVRRFIPTESLSATVDIQAHESGDPVSQALPTAITINGITYNSVEVQWRDDNTLKLGVLL
jgi:hypothetical protein